jgi:uncharacterized membrane protein
MPVTPLTRNSIPALKWSLLILLSGTAVQALVWQSILQDASLARNFVSSGLWEQLLRALGAKVTLHPEGAASAQVGWDRLWLLELGASLVCWLLGAAVIARCRRLPWHAGLALWGFWGWLWGLAGGAWEIARLLAHALAWDSGDALLYATPELWQGMLWAGWLTTFIALAQGAREPACLDAGRSNRMPRAVWAAVAAYAICFGTLNLLLYQGLLVPHGDSAMYEEHLWNLLHGKGFRSYLDQGLFLGEHIQVIHLGLLPLYVLWPSHLLLEACESLALAAGAIPVFWIARRHSGSPAAGALLACCYLLYFPMQRLDISIDFKTFRPEAFGIPLLLAAFEALDRQRWKSTLLWLAAALLVKEDYALIIAPVGVWIALTTFRESTAPPGAVAKRRWLGAGLALFGVVYLALAVKVVIPYFRSGDPVHYTRYFTKFGATSNEILFNLATRPGLLLSELFTVENTLFALALLLPVGGLPLLSPSRLAVGLPLFGALCLNEIARNPQHHFHAPLVAILFWAAAAGLENLPRIAAWCQQRWSRLNPAVGGPAVVRFAACWGLACALGLGLFHSFGPLGLPFWDQYSPGYWRQKYEPGRRAALFPRVLAEIPTGSRVASTDFIHPRFTHYLRSYDYSGYRPNLPADTDYLVIDTHGPYSEIRRPDQIKEYREHPQEWELLPDTTEGFFIVLKRRRTAEGGS